MRSAIISSLLAGFIAGFIWMFISNLAGGQMPSVIAAIGLVFVGATSIITGIIIAIIRRSIRSSRI